MRKTTSTFMMKTALFSVFVLLLIFFVSSSSCFQFPFSHHHDSGSNCFSCREKNKTSQSTSSPVSRFETKTMSSTEPSMMGSSSRSSVSRDHAVSSSSSSLPWLPETSSNSRMSSLLQPLSSRNAFFETAAQLEKKFLSLTSSKHLKSDVERTGAVVMQDKMTKSNEQAAVGKIMARTGRQHERVTALMKVFQNMNLEGKLIFNSTIPISRVSRGFYLVKLFSNLLNIMPLSEVKYQEERETNEQDVTLETIVTTISSLPFTLSCSLSCRYVEESQCNKRLTRLL